MAALGHGSGRGWRYRAGGEGQRCVTTSGQRPRSFAWMVSGRRAALRSNNAAKAELAL